MSNHMIELILQNECNAQIPTEKQLHNWVELALASNAKSNLVIRIVDTEESAQLNKSFRHKQGPTNILSFHDEAIPGFPDNDLGTLVVCADLIEDEAEQLKIPIDHHWAHLIVHGVLHLQGYDHNSDHEAAVMEQKEIDILSMLDIDNPYHEHKENGQSQ